jgi:L-2-hydroxyglutarate oxidase
MPTYDFAIVGGEMPLLDHLYQRGLANGLAVGKLSAAELREIEPHTRGLAGIRVASTGIVNYQQVARRFAQLMLYVEHEVYRNPHCGFMSFTPSLLSSWHQ